MKRLLVLLLVAGCASSSNKPQPRYVQKAIIVGMAIGLIFDHATATGIPAATVEFDSKLVTSANRDGAFYMELEPGMHTAVFSKPGYVTATATVNIESNRETQMHIELNPVQ
jgi:hypothetical protein